MKNQKKFQIERFQIAKLSNPKTIFGGTGVGDNDPTTNTQNPNPKPKPDDPKPGPIIQGPGNPKPNSTAFCSPF
ncbi:conserved hypothetical protein [Flavobacterium sp. 9AF]|uniref:hypothetical protein n=1 Tax=Flavobacterium sp. 9AF TaxID=2653142 RepID=UPI0012F11698|nr:hypothetical protein [Flavobacterium sp. 9AF]VXB50575.1 conserved hypothetical protein [Flavobacterium sp. 9AF]